MKDCAKCQDLEAKLEQAEIYLKDAESRAERLEFVYKRETEVHREKSQAKRRFWAFADKGAVVGIVATPAVLIVIGLIVSLFK